MAKSSGGTRKYSNNTNITSESYASYSPDGDAKVLVSDTGSISFRDDTKVSSQRVELIKRELLKAMRNAGIPENVVGNLMVILRENSNHNGGYSNELSNSIVVNARKRMDEIKRVFFHELGHQIQNLYYPKTVIASPYIGIDGGKDYRANIKEQFANRFEKLVNIDKKKFSLSAINGIHKDVISHVKQNSPHLMPNNTEYQKNMNKLDIPAKARRVKDEYGGYNKIIKPDRGYRAVDDNGHIIYIKKRKYKD